MKKYWLLGFLMLFVLPALALAQGGADLGDIITQAQIIFIGGLGGLSVLGLTEILKGIFKTTGIGSVILSVVVSIAAVVFYLLQTSQFTLFNFIIYTVLVAMVANGLFRFPNKNNS